MTKLPLQLEAIGPGNVNDLSPPGLIAFHHYIWSDDGRQVVYEGQTDQNQWNVCRPAVAGGAPVLVKTAARDTYPSKSSQAVGDRHSPADISTDLGQDQFASSRNCRAVKID